MKKSLIKMASKAKPVNLNDVQKATNKKDPTIVDKIKTVSKKTTQSRKENNSVNSLKKKIESQELASIGKSKDRLVNSKDILVNEPRKDRKKPNTQNKPSKKTVKNLSDVASSSSKKHFSQVVTKSVVKSKEKAVTSSDKLIRKDLQISSREKEVLSLFAVAMEAFNNLDFAKAYDVFQLIISEFAYESEIIVRSKMFIRICEQRLALKNQD